MDDRRKREKMERARQERLEREERMKTEEGERREKMAEVFEKMVKYRIKDYDPDDTEMIHYQYVEIYQNFTKEGPRPGDKFKNVDLNADTGDVVFRLKTGGRRIVILSLKKPPTYGGEFDPPKDLEEEDVDENGEFIIPKGRQSRI